MPVYEPGYRHFEGERAPRLFRFAPIAANGFRLAIRSKLFLFLVIFPSQISLIVGTVFVYIVFQQAPAILNSPEARLFAGGVMAPELQERIGAALYFNILSIQTSLWVPVVGAMLAGRLVAADAQANALEVYFSRPITRLDYALGKYLTAFGFFLYVTLLPTLGVWIVACLLAADSTYFKSTIGVGSGIVLTSALVASVSAALLLGLSSASKKPRFASALWIGVIIFSTVASEILLESVRQPGCYLVSFLFHFRRLGYDFFSSDLVSQVTRRGIPLPAPAASFAVLGAVVIVSLFLFVKRLRAVEIVR